MSRFRAGAARRSARLCCDEVDGSRVARHRSPTPHPRPPVGSLAGRRGSVSPTNGSRAGCIGWPSAQASRKKAFGPALDLGSGAKVRPARSRAAGERAESAGPLHGPHSRGRRRHDARRGWGARAFGAVARRSFAGPARAAASRLAAILSAMSGRRRATLFPERMAPGDDNRLRAPREPPARPPSGLTDRHWRRSTRRRCGRENDCAPSRLRSRQRKGAASRRRRPTHGRNLGRPRPPRDGRGRRRRRRHPFAGEARSAASGGVDIAPGIRARPRPVRVGPRH